MNLVALSRRIGIPVFVLGTISGSAAAAPPGEAHDLEGVWKLVATRGQVGICGTGTIDSAGRLERGRVATRHGAVRLERDAEESFWRIKRLRPDGSVVTPVRKWTAEVGPDGSVVSSESTMAICADEPPRWYEIALEGKMKAKKRLRIELRGTDEPCPKMGCSFKITYVLTREREAVE